MTEKIKYTENVQINKNLNRNFSTGFFFPFYKRSSIKNSFAKKCHVHKKVQLVSHVSLRSLCKFSLKRSGFISTTWKETCAVCCNLRGASVNPSIPLILCRICKTLEVRGQASFKRSPMRVWNKRPVFQPHLNDAMRWRWDTLACCGRFSESSD